MLSNYKIWLSPPVISEEILKKLHLELAQDIAKPSNSLQKFEKGICKLTGGKYAVGLNSCTSALHLSMILEGIGKGDIVLTSTFTYVAAANAIRYSGAAPVFIDSEPETWNMCPELLEKAITTCIARGTKPAAVMIVHTYGMPAKIEEINEICRKYEIPLIEDAAGSLGSKYCGQMTGTFGKYGTYSFNYNKIITTGGGGALLVPNADLVQKAKYIATHARSNKPHYEHEVTGYNYIMGGMAAALGHIQFSDLDNRIRIKRAIYDRYYYGLNEISQVSFLDEPQNCYTNRWLSNIAMENENDVGKLKSFLMDRGVETRNLWKPMHLQPTFEQCESFSNGVSLHLFKRGLSLPSGVGLEESHQNHIIELIQEFFSNQ